MAARTTKLAAHNTSTLSSIPSETRPSLLAPRSSLLTSLETRVEWPHCSPPTTRVSLPVFSGLNSSKNRSLSADEFAQEETLFPEKFASSSLLLWLLHLAYL